MGVSSSPLTCSVLVDLLNWITPKEKCIDELVSVKRRTVADTDKDALWSVRFDMAYEGVDRCFN